MTIFEGSRYEESDVVLIAGNDGVVRQTIQPTPEVRQGPLNFSFYTVVEGDRIDTLALKFLGDGELWWMIAAYNPQKSFYDWLPVGQVLRIPNGLQPS